MNKSAQRLALGTVQFGLPYGVANQTGQVLRPEAKEMLQLAKSHGLDLLDTAIGYGESEVCLGEVGTKSFNIITKLPVISESCTDVAGWVREQVAASCLRLRVKKVYGLLLHRSADLLGLNGKYLIEALDSIKKEGLVEKVGVSVYSPAELDSISQLFCPDLVQAPFNLIDRTLYTSGWLHRLKEQGVEIHTRSAFLQGLLLMDKDERPARFSKWNDLWQAWHSWLIGNDESALHMCLAFPLSFPEIDRVLVGADTVTQLEQIIKTTDTRFLGSFPDIESDDTQLINPSLWKSE